MDINTISIISSAVVILIVVTIGLKKILDILVGINIKIKSNEEIFQNIFSQNEEKILKFVEETNKETFNKLKEHNNNNFKEIQSLIIKDTILLEKAILNSINTIQKEIQNEAKLEKELYLEQFEIILQEINTKSENIVNQNVQLNTHIQKDLSESKNDMLKELKELSQLSKNNFEIIRNDVVNSFVQQEKVGITIQTKINNTFFNMVTLVNNLRLDNLINVSNEINKYKEGIYEDEHFLQEVGHCKIIKITDKESQDITYINYTDNGEKSYTETYHDNILKYSMKYENNKLKIGMEFDVNGEISFEYFYNEMEEIDKKIEYIYDNNLKLKDKKEINY